MIKITNFATGGIALLVAVAVAITAVFAFAHQVDAATAALSVSPSTQNVNTGASGTFLIRHNIASTTGDGVTGLSGVQTTINFDHTKIQLTSVTRGAVWTGSGLLPNPIATAIANANTTGILPQLAVTFNPGTSAPLGDQIMVSIGFTATNCGTANIALSGIEILDQDGNEIVGATSTGGNVQVICPTPSPTPGPATPTPAPTPAPTPGVIPPSTGTTNVTGTVPAGFINLTVPSAVTIPLERETTNTANVPVDIDSNTLWQLNVSDPKVPNKGYMTDGSKVLKNPMRVQAGPVQIDLRFGGMLANGAGDTQVGAQLRQLVVPADQPGNYGIDVQFQAVAGF